MFCLRHWAGYLLTTAVLGCLSAATLTAGSSLLVSESAVEDNAKHRGSGRITSQEFSLESAIAYRGTGRCHQEDQPTVAHRGSGRLDSDLDEQKSSAYRGSGRISADEIALSEVS